MSRLHRGAVGALCTAAFILPLQFLGAPGATAATVKGAAASSKLGVNIIAAKVTLSPTAGTPGTTVTVSGKGFAALEAVDIYLGATDEVLASANATGSFTGIHITIPASATPGPEYITAVGRHSGTSAQATFLVNTNWPQFRQSGKRRATNTFENVLSPTTVAGIDEDWNFLTKKLIESSPAVVNGAVYVGSGDGNVYAFTTVCGPS